MEQQVCAFTGHRPNRFAFGYQENHPDCIRIKNAIGRAVSSLVEQGVVTFVSGMAQGVDLWAARAVLRQREQNPALRLLAVQPCADQADRWPWEIRREYEEILAMSDERVCLNASYTPACMMERNRWMVDRAGILLAVYDGSAKGGTAFTVRYAQSKQREIWLLDPASLYLAKMVLQEEDEQLSF
ncbi:MAG: SLOG family protein [Oscillospiraceae bacterium]|nr:SLOG family protein [Oscillospiraceae bacterium]